MSDVLHVVFIGLAVLIGGTAAVAILYRVYLLLFVEPRQERERRERRKIDEIRYYQLEAKDRSPEEEDEYQALRQKYPLKDDDYALTQFDRPGDNR